MRWHRPFFKPRLQCKSIGTWIVHILVIAQQLVQLAPPTTSSACFIQDTDRTLHRIGFNGTASGAWENCDGALYSDPSCVWFDNAETHCFAATSTGDPQQKKSASSWQPWANLGGTLDQTCSSRVTPT